MKKWQWKARCLYNERELLKMRTQQAVKDSVECVKMRAEIRALKAENDDLSERVRIAEATAPAAPDLRALAEACAETLAIEGGGLTGVCTIKEAAEAILAVLQAHPPVCLPDELAAALKDWRMHSSGGHAPGSFRGSCRDFTTNARLADAYDARPIRTESEVEAPWKERAEKAEASLFEKILGAEPVCLSMAERDRARDEAVEAVCKWWKSLGGLYAANRIWAGYVDGKIFDGAEEV